MEDKIILTAKQQLLLEKATVVHEKLGHTPASSQILALLLISDQVELTFDQIRNTLNLSKSATSNALNMLIQMGRIEYITKMGDRKRYFRSLIGGWKNKFKEINKNTFELNNLFKEILQNRTKSTLDFNYSLQEFIDFMDYMEVEMPKLFKNWELNKETKKK
ncbi:MAG: MarR family transcriptional regulator [Vicingaceae bacterium]|nr:MarR family transcriptional regulator [Vicingaceae bacterium]